MNSPLRPGRAPRRATGPAIAATLATFLGSLGTASAQIATDLNAFVPQPPYLNISTASAVNSRGQVTGRGQYVDSGIRFDHTALSSPAGAPVGDIHRPTMGALFGMAGTVTLPPFGSTPGLTPGGIVSRFSVGLDISDLGVIVGRCDINDALPPRPGRDAGYYVEPIGGVYPPGGRFFVPSPISGFPNPTGTRTIVREPAGRNYSQLNALEGAYQTATGFCAFSSATAGLQRKQAIYDYALYNSFPFQYQALLIPYLPGGNSSEGNDINSRFEIVGQDDVRNGVQLVRARAFYYNFGPTIDMGPADINYDGIPDDLDALANGISQNGFYAAGASGDFNDFVPAAFQNTNNCLWFQTAPAVFLPYRFDGFAPGLDSVANDVQEDRNFNPVVVGTAERPVIGIQNRAYLFTFTGGPGYPAGIVDLNAIAYVPALPPGVVLTEATQVRLTPNSDRLLISCNARVPTGGVITTHAYLVQVPAP